MTIESAEDLEGMRRAGRVVAETLRAMRAAARPGVSTGQLDAVAGDVFARAGARSGPRLDYDFPGHTCISVNDEAVHGVPGPRRLRDGDVVKLDVTAELDGYYADACVTALVGRGAARPRDRRLVRSASRALAAGMEAARAGSPVNAIGAAVERSVRADGHAVCRDLAGHGIGRRIHEEPNVPNHFVPSLTTPLHEGLVMTIEPIVSAGSGGVVETSDGWTYRSTDGARVAHAEHTMVVRRDRAPLVLTA